MRLNKEEINLLYHLLKSSWGYNEAIEWAYSKYTDDGAPDWIEKITLAYDLNEILFIIRESHGVNGELTQDQEIGSIANSYFNGDNDIRGVVRELYEFVCLPSTEHPLKSYVYIADDHFEWDEKAETVASDLLGSKLGKYLQIYKELERRIYA